MDDGVGAGGDVARPEDVLRRFLAIVEPEQLNDGAPPPPQNDEPALHAWTLLYASHPSPEPTLDAGSLAGTSEMRILVRAHPDPAVPLFSVRAFLPHLDARRFWTLMAESANRHLWDASILSAEVEPWKREGTSSAGAHRTGTEYRDSEELRARIEVLTFGAIFMVTKARDMVLMSVDARLPPRRDSQAPPALRLLSASQSICHPAYPTRKRFSRFQLCIGGFLVEDVPAPPTSTGPQSNGIIVTQISDLGPAATWLPSSIIKMVASTLVPRSLAKIAECARSMTVPEELLPTFDQSDNRPRPGHRQDSRTVKLVGGAGEVWEVGRTLPVELGSGQERKRRGPVADIVEAARSLFLPSSPERRSRIATPAKPQERKASAELHQDDEQVPRADISSTSAMPLLDTASDAESVPSTPPRTTQALLTSSTPRAARSDQTDECEDVSTLLADALADELDRISVQAVKTLRHFTSGQGRLSLSASVWPDISASFACGVAGAGKRLDDDSQRPSPASQPTTGEEDEAQRRRRRESRRLLDESGLCAMLLAPGVAHEDDVLGSPTASKSDTQAAGKRLSLAGQAIVDAYRAGVEDEVLAVLTGMGHDAVVSSSASSWWPSFGLLWGVLPVISWSS